MTTKRRTAAQRLHMLASDVYREIYNMTPRQRTAAWRAVAELNDHNCSWTLYAMRSVLMGFIDQASSPRERAHRIELARKQKP